MGRSRSLKMATIDRSLYDLLLVCHCIIPFCQIYYNGAVTYLYVWYFFKQNGIFPIKFLPRITGSALALHCCKAHAKINGKIENSTPCKIVTHEDFNLKLGTCDYVAEATQHATLVSNRPSGGFPPNMGNITPV